MAHNLDKHWKFRIISSIYIGYAAYYLSRKAFTYIAPFLIIDLSITKIDIGVVSSILSLTYGTSKLISGILCDYFNSRYFLAFGLIATGLCAILCGFSSSLQAFAILGGLNGWFQGFGWPACTNLLTNYFNKRERGKWWSFCSTAHTVGGAIIAYISVYYAKNYNWQSGIIVPGTLCIIIGLWLINRLKNLPEVNYVDQFQANPLIHQQELSSQNSLKLKHILLEHVFSNGYVWLLAFSYFFTYIIRTAVSDWLPLFLVEEKEYSIADTVICVFLFEIGGFIGILAAGWGSDYLFQGRRIPLAILSFLIMFFFIMVLWYLPSDRFIINFIIIQCIGCLVFCPQMLIGLAAAELVVKKAVSTSNGFVGFFGYMGSAVAGYPLGVIIEIYGWYNFILVLVMCGILSLIALFHMFIYDWKTLNLAND